MFFSSYYILLHTKYISILYYYIPIWIIWVLIRSDRPYMEWRSWNSLMGDILMATLGMVAIRQFAYSPKPPWYIAVHVGYLSLHVSPLCKFYGTRSYGLMYYGLIVSIMGVLISIEWAMFTVVNLIIIAGIATGFTQPFSHTPVATIMSLVTTSIIAAYKYGVLGTYL